ncbi:MAG: succinate dehydrogenase assembly factor 2 [Pseudohongiellaceae bacterium]|nr:succinate dehydrogenase assembly factor 2 [Pseudohongiellaceae bacterium]
MLTEIEFKKLGWHSRRGMLELDLILLPFYEKHLADLPPEIHVLYQRLLTEEDQDLFAWLLMRAPAPNEELQKMISIIREHHDPQ